MGQWGMVVMVEHSKCLPLRWHFPNLNRLVYSTLKVPWRYWLPGVEKTKAYSTAQIISSYKYPVLTASLFLFLLPACETSEHSGCFLSCLPNDSELPRTVVPKSVFQGLTLDLPNPSPVVEPKNLLLVIFPFSRPQNDSKDQPGLEITVSYHNYSDFFFK